MYISYYIISNTNSTSVFLNILQTVANKAFVCLFLLYKDGKLALVLIINIVDTVRMLTITHVE